MLMRREICSAVFGGLRWLGRAGGADLVSA